LRPPSDNNSSGVPLAWISKSPSTFPAATSRTRSSFPRISRILQEQNAGADGLIIEMTEDTLIRENRSRFGEYREASAIGIRNCH
jgi:hypothetical protein